MTQIEGSVRLVIVTKRLGVRLRWFDDGAPVLRHVLTKLGHLEALPETEEYYACPCCLVAYERSAVVEGILTDEHVPPKKLGGRAMALTCKPCNNEAGHEFDAHAVQRSRANDFMQRKPVERPWPATMTAGGIKLRGTAQWRDDGVVQLFGVPKQNDPVVQAAHFAALDGFVDKEDPSPDMSFTVHLDYDEARARYSWIRSAYLAAFAGLGYSYIFRHVMQPIRDQLARTNDNILPTYLFTDHRMPSTERRMLLVDDPDDLRCVAVMMGPHMVVLPGLFRPQTFEELAEAFKAYRDGGNRITVNLNGKEVPWPTWPTYLLDRPAISSVA